MNVHALIKLVCIGDCINFVEQTTQVQRQGEACSHGLK